MDIVRSDQGPAARGERPDDADAGDGWSAGTGAGAGQPEGANAARSRRRLTNTIKESLRQMTTQLSLLNHQVGNRVDLNDIDLNCLDLIARHGPLSPTALARRAGLHPATVTGILDRLQRGGWVVRDRETGGPDRRAVAVRLLRERGGHLLRLYSGMSASMDEICAGYTDAELELLASFLRRATEAGRGAADDLSGG
jgi:DNA-binding MarR family transcriptional regulator